MSALGVNSPTICHFSDCCQVLTVKWSYEVIVLGTLHLLVQKVIGVP